MSLEENAPADSSDITERLKSAALLAAPLVHPLAVRYARKHNVPKGYLYFLESGIFMMGIYRAREEISQFAGRILESGEVEIEESTLKSIAAEDVERFEEISAIFKESQTGSDTAV